MDCSECGLRGNGVSLLVEARDGLGILADTNIRSKTVGAEIESGGCGGCGGCVVGSEKDEFWGLVDKGGDRAGSDTEGGEEAQSDEEAGEEHGGGRDVDWRWFWRGVDGRG